MKSLLFVILLSLFCLTANAKFGGGGGGSHSSFGGGSRSSFSSSSSSRSSFSSSPSRSTSFGGATRSGPATITRSAPAPQPSRSTTVIHNTTVVNRGSSSNGLVTGMILGSALSHPRTQVVYVNGQPQQQQVYVDNNGQQVAPPVVVVQESHWFLWTMGIVIVVFIIFSIL